MAHFLWIDVCLQIMHTWLYILDLYLAGIPQWIQACYRTQSFRQHRQQLVHQLALSMARDGVFLCITWRRIPRTVFCGSCLDHSVQCKASRLLRISRPRNAKDLDLSPWPITMNPWWQYRASTASVWEIAYCRCRSKPTNSRRKTRTSDHLVTPYISTTKIADFHSSWADMTWRTSICLWLPMKGNIQEIHDDNLHIWSQIFHYLSNWIVGESPKKTTCVHYSLCIIYLTLFSVYIELSLFNICVDIKIAFCVLGRLEEPDLWKIISHNLLSVFEKCAYSARSKLKFELFQYCSTCSLSPFIYCIIYIGSTVLLWVILNFGLFDFVVSVLSCMSLYFDRPIHFILLQSVLY